MIPNALSIISRVTSILELGAVSFSTMDFRSEEAEFDEPFLGEKNRFDGNGCILEENFTRRWGSEDLFMVECARGFDGIALSICRVFSRWPLVVFSC